MLNKNVLASLALIANELDSYGLSAEASEIDGCLRRIAQIYDTQEPVEVREEVERNPQNGQTVAVEQEVQPAQMAQPQHNPHADMKQWFDAHAVSKRPDGLRAQLARMNISEQQLFDQALEMCLRNTATYPHPVDALRELCNKYAQQGRAGGRGQAVVQQDAQLAPLQQWFAERVTGTRADSVRAQLKRENISDQQFLQMAMKRFQAQPQKYPNAVEALRSLCTEYSQKSKAANSPMRRTTPRIVNPLTNAPRA